MLTRVHSVLVLVPELDAARADYARLIGREPARLERSADGARSAFFVFSNTALELREITAEDADPVRSGQGGLRLLWEGDDPDASLAGRGIAASAGRSESALGLEGAGQRAWTAHRIAPEAARGLPVELIREETTEALPSLDEQSEQDPARIHALDHLVVMSPAPDETRAFFGEGLEIRLALDKTFEQRGVRLLFFRLGGVTIEVGARANAEPAPESADRFGGLAWQVPDADAIRARLAADGFDVSEVRTGHKPGTRVCTVRDPVHDVPTLLIEPVRRV